MKRKPNSHLKEVRFESVFSSWMVRVKLIFCEPCSAMLTHAGRSRVWEWVRVF